jgi:hypothetical protein
MFRNEADVRLAVVDQASFSFQLAGFCTAILGHREALHDQERSQNKSVWQVFAKGEYGHRAANDCRHRADLAEINRTGDLLQLEQRHILLHESHDRDQKDDQHRRLKHLRDRPRTLKVDGKRQGKQRTGLQTSQTKTPYRRPPAMLLRYAFAPRIALRALPQLTFIVGQYWMQIPSQCSMLIDTTCHAHETPSSLDRM